MVRVRALRIASTIRGACCYLGATIREQSTSFAPTALRMFASLDHDAIMASFHLIHGDERGPAPKSGSRTHAMCLRKFYRNFDCMIVLQSVMRIESWSARTVIAQSSVMKSVMSDDPDTHRYQA